MIGGILLLITLRILAIYIIPPIYDEMVQICIGDDIAHFSRFPIYFYGQQYMGPLESYFFAPFFRFWGSSLIAARFYYEFFYLSFLALSLWAVRQLFGRELVSHVLLLLSVLPFPALFFTTVINYGEILAFSALSLVLLLKISEGGKTPRGQTLFLGLSSGLAFWCNPIFIIWLIPLGMILLLIPSGWKKGIPWLFGAGFLVGLFPIWIHGLRTGTLMSLEGAGGGGFAQSKDIARVFYLFFARMKYFLSTFSSDAPPPFLNIFIRYLSLVPFTLFAISFGAVLFYFLRSFPSLTLQKKIFYIFTLAPPFLLAASYSLRNLTTDEGIRFFLPLLFPYAFSISWWVGQFRSPVWKKVILGILVSVLLACSFISMKAQFLITSNYRGLTRFLEQKGLSSGVADMRVAYALNALSRNKILATPVPKEARCQPILSRVREKGAQFLILEHADPRFRKELETDRHLTKISLSGYDIFYGPSKLLQKIVEQDIIPT